VLSYASPFDTGLLREGSLSAPSLTPTSPAAMSETDRVRSVVMFSLSMLFFWASLYIYVPILPVYASFLGAAPSVVGLVVGIYGFSQLVIRIPLGLWSDQLGKRKPFVVLGMLLAAVGCFTMVLQPDPWYLVWGRAVIGLAAATWVCSTVLFSSYFPPSQAVKAMGLATFLSSAPQIVTSLLGGNLADRFGWTFPFYSGIGLGVLGLVSTLGIKETPLRRPQSVSWRRFQRISSIPVLMVVSAIGLLNHFSLFATTYTFVPIYASNLGASKTELGAIMMVAMVANSLATLVAFRVAKGLGDGRTVAIGLAVGGITLLGTPFVGNLEILAALQLISGLARGLVYPVLMGLCVRIVTPEDQATSVGIFQASYALGMFTGPFLGGVVGEHLGLPIVFAIMGLVSLLGAALGALGLRQTSHQMD